MLEEKDGKINDYNEIFAFFPGLEKTMNKRCDNLNYLVTLRAPRQLLLERAVGKPGGVKSPRKMAGDKDNAFFFSSPPCYPAPHSLVKKTNRILHFLFREGNTSALKHSLL